MLRETSATTDTGLDPIELRTRGIRTIDVIATYHGSLDAVSEALREMGERADRLDRRTLDAGDREPTGRSKG